MTKVTAGSGIGDFTANLEELELDTEYYVRAYAVNSEGTAYGETVSFRTEEEGGEEEEEKEPDGDTKTGDSGLPWVWWLLCSVAAAGITVLIVSKKGSLHSLRYSLYRSFLLDFWISIMRLAFRKVFLNLCGIIKKANIYVCCVYKALIQYKF